MSDTTTPTPTTATTEDPAWLTALVAARPLVSIDGAAELTDTSRSTIVRAIGAGEIPRRKVGRRVLLATADVLSWAGAS